MQHVAEQNVLILQLWIIFGTKDFRHTAAIRFSRSRDKGVTSRLLMSCERIGTFATYLHERKKHYNHGNRFQ